MGHLASEDEIKQILSKPDLDGNGEIEFNEFVVVIKKLLTLADMESSSEDEEKKAEAEAVFNAFDEDGSGEISVNELKKALETLGQNPTDKEIQQLIKEADEDGSGEIDKDEFVALVGIYKKK